LNTDDLFKGGKKATPKTDSPKVQKTSKNPPKVTDQKDFPQLK